MCIRDRYRPLRLYEYHRRYLASVRRGVLELRQADLGCPAPWHADREDRLADRIAPPEQRVDQYVEDGRLPRPEAVYRRRHQVERQVPELRTGEYGLPERLSYVHVVRLFEVWLIP